MENDLYFVAAALAVFVITIVWAAVTPFVPANFSECVRAGGAIMESYPRQCQYGNRTYVEPSCSYEGQILTLKDAQKIAREECEGKLEGESFCNDASGTYWLELGLHKPGCNPACVVNVTNREARINWRCTGLNTDS